MAKILEVNKSGESLQHLSLEPNCTELEYFAYLQEKTGLDPKNPWIEQAISKGLPEKAAAHTILAYQHLTEKESHLMPLSDMASITKHALYWYGRGEIPWFDFVVSDANDIVKKSSLDKNSANTKSAPLVRDCKTFEDYLEKVVPAILEIHRNDPNAYIKMFPQSKNVEAFNLGMRIGKNGTTTYTVEMYSGAYTPRAGEDGKITVQKHKGVSKEERIVRVTIELDECGNTTVFLKPPVEFNDQGDTIQKGLEVPPWKIDWKELFLISQIVNNGETMTSSGNPFYLLANLLKNPNFTDLLKKFENVHSQLGYVDLVLSGMIGPESVFGIDIDIDTSSEYGSAAEYISSRRGQFQDHIPINQVFSKINNAEIFDERDNEIIREIKYFYLIFYELYDKMESTNAIWLTGFNRLFSILDEQFKARIHTPWLELHDFMVDERDRQIIGSIRKSLLSWSHSPPALNDDGSQLLDSNNLPMHESSEEAILYNAASGRPVIMQPKRPYISPKEQDLRRARDNKSRVPYLVNNLTVADIV